MVRAHQFVFLVKQLIKSNMLRHHMQEVFANLLSKAIAGFRKPAIQRQSMFVENTSPAAGQIESLAGIEF